MEILKIQLSEKEKTLERAKELVDYYIPDFNFGGSENWKEYFNDLSNYKLYNNELNEEEFKSYCDPLGLGEVLEDVSFKIKPYNVGAKNIDVLLGEELKRNERFSVALLGESGVKQKNMELTDKYKESVKASLQKLIAQKQVEMGQMSEDEAQQYMQYLQEFVEPKDLEVGSFQSELEILGNKIINYGYFSENIIRKKNDGFFHSLISDKEIIWIGSHNGKPTIRVENPLFIFFEKSPDEEMIQNGRMAGKLSSMHIADILTDYADDLTKEDKKKLESKLYGNRSSASPGKTMKYGVENTLTNRYAASLSNFDYINKETQEHGLYGKNKSSNSNYYNSLVDVAHVEFKWLKKVGFLDYMDEYGEESTSLVDETYPIPEETTEIEYINKYGRNVKRYEWVDELSGPKAIEWMWIEEVWEITRIDGDIYTRFRKVPDQYVSIDNPFKRKLSYHGRRYGATNAHGISAMGRQKPYIYLYIIIMYQIGELVSKNYGPVINIDTSQIDQNLGGGDPELAVPKTLAYIQRGTNFYNSLNNNQGGAMISRPQPGSVTNLSTTTDLLNMIQLLQWIDLEAGMSIGVSPQRKAQFSANSNVSDNQQSITQSSHITEKRFFLHNELWADIMQTYVDKFRRYATKRLKTSDKLELTYILPDKSRDVLTMTNVDLSELNIFPTYSSADDEYITEMRNQALVFAQNGGSIEDISNILLAKSRGTSPEELHKMIMINERARAALEQQNQEAQIATQEKQVQMQLEHREDEQLHELDKIILEGEQDRLTEEVKNKNKSSK